MSLGDIRRRELTAQEKKWRARWLKWDGHGFKSMLPFLRRMSQEEYRAWLYAIDPRDALILSTEPGFREVRDYQLNKRWYHEWRDTACRFLKR